jgi:hypothetical protein
LGSGRPGGRLFHVVVIGKEGLQGISQVGVLGQQQVSIRGVTGFHGLQIIRYDFVQSRLSARVRSRFAGHGSLLVL